MKPVVEVEERGGVGLSTARTCTGRARARTAPATSPPSRSRLRSTWTWPSPTSESKEYTGHLEPWQEVFTVGYTVNEGRSPQPGDAPGLGRAVEGTAAARYPYEPRYLPVNRLRDGSIHNW
ncbi:hypothetical protein [Salinactinospora qingdaonensis]|uniref:hypothetical protein n=1 Tax=Salinactinospora qingdaonensis TaxID=702744 RepID=UPI0031E9A2F2